MEENSVIEITEHNKQCLENIYYNGFFLVDEKIIKYKNLYMCANCLRKFVINKKYIIALVKSISTYTLLQSMATDNTHALNFEQFISPYFNNLQNNFVHNFH